MLNQAPDRLNGMSWTEKAGPVRAADMRRVLISWSELVLDGAGGDAGGDVALGDDQQDRGRDGGDHGGGHDGVPLLVVVADVVVDAEGDGLASAAGVQGAGEDEVGPGPQEGEQGHG